MRSSSWPWMSGRPRSRMISAGLLRQQLERDLAVGRFEDLVALRAQPHAQQLADRRLVVDDQDLDRRGAHAAVSSASDAGRDRQPDGEHGAAAVGAVGGRRSCRASPRRSRARSQGRGRCRRGPDRPSARDRTCRRCARAPPAECRRPRRGPAGTTASSVAPAPDADRGAGRRVFRGVVEQVEQHLLEQHRVELAASADRRRARASTLCCARILPARRSALPTISPRSCGAAFGTTAPDSSLVMSSRLAMKRLSRSDSSMMVASRSALLGIARGRWRDRAASPAAPSTEASGVLQIVRDRGQQRRAQPVGLGGALDPVDVLDQLHPLDRERALVDQRIEQAALVRRQQRPGLVAVDADDADRRRGRCASAGTAAWRPAACRRRGRPGGRSPRPSSRRRGRPRRAGPPADSRP